MLSDYQQQRPADGNSEVEDGQGFSSHRLIEHVGYDRRRNCRVACFSNADQSTHC